MAKPSDFCNWVVNEPLNNRGLIIGEYPDPSNHQHIDGLISVYINVWLDLSNVTDKYTPDYKEYVIKNYEIQLKKKSPPKFFILPIDSGNICKDSKMFDMVEKIYQLFLKENIVYVHCGGGHGRSGIFASCFLKRHYGYSTKKAIDENRKLHLTRKIDGNVPSPQTKKQILQVKRYRPPHAILVTGDRNSSTSFQSIIRTAFKCLPPHSIIILGDYQGIDTTARIIAWKLGLKIKSFPIIKDDLNVYGRGAGPRRNKMMLEYLLSLSIGVKKFVYAFHPDIRYSKGTKNMMIQAYSNKINIYYFDLKRKVQFEGNFDI